MRQRNRAAAEVAGELDGIGVGIGIGEGDGFAQ